MGSRTQWVSFWLAEAALIASVCFATAAASAPPASSQTQCNCTGVLPLSHVPVPCVCIPACATGTVATVDSFTPFNQSGSGPLPPPATSKPTKASLCYTDRTLELRWEITKAKIVKSNCGVNRAPQLCNKCRDEVWMGDAAEFYFTDELQDQHQNVSEIDVSPIAGGMWASYINNSGGYYPEKGGQVVIPCDVIKVDSSFTPTGWAKNLSIPWSVLTHHAIRPTQYRIQFYRMDYATEHAPTLSANAWSVPRCDGVERCNAEHVPKYFGVAKLV